ncbi:MAG TPA: IS1634 family transposase [Streptosporangiaceae bacterium]
MYVDVVPNRNSPPAILLRQSLRQGNRIHKQTLANLSDWPPAQVNTLRRVLKGETLIPPDQAFQIVRTLPHGHVAAVLGTLRRLQLDQLLAREASRPRDLVVAMIVARILDPRSKLATARGLGGETRFSSLGELLQLEAADEDALYRAMDWLLPRQARIEEALAKRHLAEGTLVLYDLTSTYFEGQHCPLARLGHSRDHRPGHRQIVFGLLTNADGCPVAVEVFEGNTGDPKTVAAQVSKLRKRFGLQHVVLVGDRGMLTQARIREDLKIAPGIEWITALRAPQIQALVSDGRLQLSLFDEKDLAEITHPAYPGERLIVCRNPLLADERHRKRQELLAATERELKKVKAAVERSRRPLRGKSNIALTVGRVLGRYKVGKHFRLRIEEERLEYERRQAKIDQEAALDGFYVIRTNVPRDVFSSQQAVCSYKGLSAVERAFRSFKSVDLQVRPIHHRLPDRVRAHVFLCLLAYYVEWHLRQAWAPILFDDHHKAAGEALRESVVAPAQRSPQAQRKALTKRTEDDLPVHSFQTLLADLQTLAKNKIQMGAVNFEMITTPTTLQRRAFDLLQVSYRL